MTEKVHCWDGSKFFECMNEVKEEFVAYTDWDTDSYSSGEGCHGGDIFGKGDFVNMAFSRFSDGYIVVSFKSRFVYGDQFVVTPDDRFLKRAFVEMRPVDVVSRQPKLFSLKNSEELPPIESAVFGNDVLADQTFLNCFRNSQNINLSLTDSQRVVVERFFSAVKTAFPEAFAGATKAKPAVANTPESTNLRFGSSMYWQ